MFRFIIVTVVLLISHLPAFAAENPGATSTDGFVMTGMQRETVTKETEALKFKGMRRETAKRVLKETSKKNI